MRRMSVGGTLREFKISARQSAFYRTCAALRKHCEIERAANKIVVSRGLMSWSFS